MAPKTNKQYANKQIVCVDDQPEVRELLTEIFTDRGKTVHAFATGEEALAHVQRHVADVSAVVLDIDLGPGRPDGIQVLRQLRKNHPDLPVVILTGKGSVDLAVKAVKEGATDFVEKDPFLEDKLDLSVAKIARLWAALAERDELAATNRGLRVEVDKLRAAQDNRLAIVGESPEMTAVLEKVARVAKISRPILIVGERGTGKELVAHAIHRGSLRASGPFVVLNCAAVAESLLESELFGHERGAFTGATQRKLGTFELAHGGTLFLDEIGNMSMDFQMKILRVLEYQRFTRVAGSREIEVDVRVLAATNADLSEAISAGAFRADLYDRLAFDVVHLPPLRERKSDINALAEVFFRRFAQEVGGLPCGAMGAEAIVALMAYDYPGNIRELKNIVERAVYRATHHTLRADDVIEALPGGGGGPRRHDPPQAGDFMGQVDSFQKQLLTAALGAHTWSQKDAAASLGLSYDQFRHLYRKYELASLRR